MSTLQVLWESLALLLLNMIVALAFAVVYFYQQPQQLEIIGRLL